MIIVKSRLNCIELTNILGKSTTQSRIRPNQKLTLTWGGHASGCEGTGAEIRMGWQLSQETDATHLLFLQQRSRKSKDSKSSKKSLQAQAMRN